VVASSTILISAAFSVTVTAIETFLTIKVNQLPPDPPGTIDATIGSGCGAVAALGAYCPDSGGPLTVDPTLELPHPPLQGDVVFLR
jgi:hypothetical protein